MPDARLNVWNKLEKVIWKEYSPEQKLQELVGLYKVKLRYASAFAAMVGFFMGVLTSLIMLWFTQKGVNMLP